MCRADIHPDARALLGSLLGDMAATLADDAGLRPEDVLIGPVDFGEEER